jgi:ABC-2 type transport system ATP-binding protein
MAKNTKPKTEKVIVKKAVPKSEEKPVVKKAAKAEISTAKLHSEIKSKKTTSDAKNELVVEPLKMEEVLSQEVKTSSTSGKAKKDRPVIQVKNLSKMYGTNLVVNNVSFDVKRGEIFGILGPNGAGKTTTLEMIETLLPKSSGEILIDGLNIDTYPEHVKKIVGIQLQSSGFYPRINLVETLELFADIYDVEIDALKLLESVNLLDKAKFTPEQLSGGQRQRFSIATTLVADPVVVFLDEPTTGLDPQARRNLWDMVMDLKAKGKTIVITTHYMDEAEVLCDRIAIMDGGKILQINTAQGYIEELLAKGFSRPQPKLGATLEDVFLDLTGKQLRE